MSDSSATAFFLTLAQGADPGAALSQGSASAGSAAPTSTGTAAPGTPPAGTQQQQQQGPPNMMLLLMVAFVGFIMLTTLMGGRRDKKRRQGMLSDLAKHDEVVTIGGVIGKVVEIRDQEVVLKVDENSNSRMRFLKSSIQQVIKATGSNSATAAGPSVEVKTRAEKAAV